MANEEHYFYVLQCSDGSYYGGYTNNLERRLRAHNEGKGAKYTKGRGPVAMIFKKRYETKSDALKAEYYFKQLPRKKKDEYLHNERSVEHVAAKKL